MDKRRLGIKKNWISACWCAPIVIVKSTLEKLQLPQETVVEKSGEFREIRLRRTTLSQARR